MIRIHYPYKNNPKLDNKEIRGLQTQKRHQIFLSNAFLLVIRLDFVPFGYFLALSVSFPRLYALSKRVHY